MLVFGARLLVASATTIAQAAGLSDLVIGLTVVAIGTSLPEVATSVIAGLRGQREMAIGNVVGSNVFNIGAVMGVTALIAPHDVPVDPAAVRLDMPVMLAAAVVLLPMALTRSLITRWEAVVLLGYYAAYVTYLLLAAGSHDALPAFSATVLWFLLPLTALSLTVLVIKELRRRAAAAPMRQPVTSAIACPTNLTERCPVGRPLLVTHPSSGGASRGNSPLTDPGHCCPDRGHRCPIQENFPALHTCTHS